MTVGVAHLKQTSSLLTSIFIHQFIIMTITGRSFLIASLLASSVAAENLRTTRQLQQNSAKAPEGVEAKHPAAIDGVPGTPTKSPSSGVHKPTWYYQYFLPSFLMKTYLTQFSSFLNTTGNHPPNLWKENQ